MGIQGLNPFLNDLMTRTRTLPLSEFSGQPIAIDGHFWGYVNISIANKVVAGYTAPESPEREAVLRKWYSSALETVLLFLSHDITPVFIFDGEHPPEKAAIQDKRKEARRKDKERIKELQSEFEGLSPLDYDQEKVKELRKLLSRCNYIAIEEFTSLKKLLQGIGIPVLQAKGDAEQLCAALAKEGLVSGVMSEDTDNLVYGCPLLITNINTNFEKQEKEATVVFLKDILRNLGMDQSKFIDFCIMCGCDFNTRIPRIGPKTAYSLLQNEDLENIPYDLTPLNYERCRQIFSHCPPEIGEDDLIVKKGDLKILESYDMGSYIKLLKPLVKKITPAEGWIHNPPSKIKIIKVK